MSRMLTRRGFDARFMAAALLFASATAVHAQVSSPATCPATQRLEARVGFDSFDCEGCKLRRDPETGVAYVEFTKPPVVRGVGTSGALRDGDQLTHVDGSMITTPFGARRFATLQRGTDVRFTVRRNNAAMEVTLAPEFVCKAATATNWGREDFQYYSLDSSLANGWLRGLRLDPFQGLNKRYTDWVFKADSLNFKHWAFSDSAFGYRPLGIPLRGFGDTSQFDYSKAYYTTFLRPGSNVQPQGWFGFSLDCDGCSYGGKGASASAWGATPFWHFNGAPRIVSVDSTGPAHRAGLRVGDVLTAIDGEGITTISGGGRFSAVQPGDTVQLRYTRGSASHNVRLVAAQRPPENTWAMSRADLVLQAPGQGNTGWYQISGDNITVTEDPKTGERTITGTNVTITTEGQTITGANITIVVRPPKPPGK